MIVTTSGLAWAVALAAVGAHGHGRPVASSCDACGVSRPAVTALLVRLQSAPNWRARDDAAAALRKVDWRCHPDVLGALAYTLAHDGNDEVREEAAESLAKMRACVPVVHEALSRAAAIDPDGPTRRRARRGLRNLARACDGGCQACGTSASPVVLPAPQESLSAPVETVIETPGLAPAPADVPAAEPLPPVDSRVVPALPDDIAPLPPPADEVKPDDGLAPLGGPSASREAPTRLAARPRPARTRVAPPWPILLRPRPSR